MSRTRVLAAVEDAFRRRLLPPGGAVLVALSGGADSVALLDALAGLRARHGFRLQAAHLDHGLRAESATDAAFCRELCERLGVPLQIGRADVRARADRDGEGLEAAARAERRAFLRRTARAQAALVALAHTRDDQAETVLLRLLRGSGRTGLGAMRARRGRLVRPLLVVGRADVLDHLRERGLPWREDASNADPRFLRNRVRHELLPYLEARFNPALRETLARAAHVLADESDLLERRARRLVREAVSRDGATVRMSRAVLRKIPRALGRLVLRQALQRTGGVRGVGQKPLDAILDLARSERRSGRRLPLPGGGEATLEFDELRLGPASRPVPFAAALPVPGRVDLPDGTWVTAERSEGPVRWDVDSAVIEMDGPLVVRTRRPGDRIRTPRKDMSLKQYLLEERVPLTVRGKLPLVASGDHVVWVPGRASAPGGQEGPVTGKTFVRLHLSHGVAGEGV